MGLGELQLVRSGDSDMQHHSSSPTSLSSPPSALSEPGSPSQYLNAGRANMEIDEIIVEPGVAARFSVMHSLQSQLAPPTSDATLTAAGLPRKKPGRKPGSTVTKKALVDGSSGEAPKQRRSKKPKDPNAPPTQRKRKAAATEDEAVAMEVEAGTRSIVGLPTTSPALQAPKITELTSMRVGMDVRPSAAASESLYSNKVARRDAHPLRSMQSILNDEPDPRSQQPDPGPPPASVPSATSPPPRQMFDPIRGGYDPVRETVTTRNPYVPGSLGSPHGPAPAPNRASASPSIASLVDPTPSVISHLPSHNLYTAQAEHRPQSTSHSALQSQQSQHLRPQLKLQSVSQTQPQPTLSGGQEATSLPSSPSNSLSVRPMSFLTKPGITEIKRTSLPSSSPANASKADIVKNPQSFTGLTTIPISASSTLAALAAANTAPAQAPVQSKKVAAVVQQERDSQKKASSSSSSPKVSGVKDALMPVPAGSDRSILDFGKAAPGEQTQVPTIELRIPLLGENNKYVNFMRLAEETFGWDALNPRLAANRERRARIAAASAALEKTAGGRESGDEMEEDLQSDGDNSNVEMGGMGTGNGIATGNDDAPAKPARKKRTFKEDEYDRNDDFVDDSELLWEEQAAASRDGFFVYSGPLVPEVEKPADNPPKRGRGGGRGRGSRGGATARGEGNGRGRGGGPGSRGGSVTRKPRITKQEKEQRDREKAEREKLVQLASKTGAGTGAYNIISTTLPSQSSAAGVVG